MPRVAACAVLACAAILAAPAANAANPVQPYGKNDAGGFHDVLPPGTRGLDNSTQLLQFQITGQRPKHWLDQLPLYRDLVYADPTLTHAQIARYYKDATFGVKPGDIESTESPLGRPGLTIIRDKRYGVPHIYGTSRSDSTRRIVGRSRAGTVMR